MPILTPTFELVSFMETPGAWKVYAGSGGVNYVLDASALVRVAWLRTFGV